MHLSASTSEQGACVSSVTYVDTRVVSLYLQAVKFTSAVLFYFATNQKFMLGSAHTTLRIVLSLKEQHEVFINSKMSFRTAGKNYFIVGTLILVGKSFPQRFCEHCLQTECWRCFCFWFS